MKRSTPMERIRRHGGLFGWATFDQLLFALSNLIVTLAVARGGGTEALGRFSVALAVYLVVLGVSRSLVSEPLLASAEGGRQPNGAPAATATVVFALVSAVVVAALGGALGRPELVVVGITLPATLLHDVLRYQGFRRQAPIVAARLDGGWVLGSVLTWPVVVRSDSPVAAVACWAGGALLGLAVAWPAVRPRFGSVPSALEWWRRDAKTLARPLLLDSALVAVSTQTVVFVLAAAAGNSALGALRAGQVYFAPIGLLLTAVGLLSLPHFAQHPGRITPGLVVRLSGATTALAGLAGAAVVFAEPVLRTILYAGSIAVPDNLLVPLAGQVVLTAASVGFVVVAKARQRGDLIVRSRLSSTAVGLLLLVPATVTWGVLGAAWALVAQTAVYVVHLGVTTLSAESRGGRDASSQRLESTP